MNSPIFRAAIQETIRSKNVTNRSPPCRFKASNGRRARAGLGCVSPVPQRSVAWANGVSFQAAA